MRFTVPPHLLLISVAAIWGFAFVAQSTGMETLGPHSFNAARFLLGALSLLPIWLLKRHHGEFSARTLLFGGLAAGTIMFGGFSFQQIGLLHTTAANAGFITGMYIVLVPIAGLLLGQSTTMQTWSGIILAILGLYSLSVGPDFAMGYGDTLELIGAFFWTAHVIILGWLSRRADAVGLSIIQFMVAALWSGIAAGLYETPSLPAFEAAWLPLLYVGVASSGIGFTLQVIAQRKVEPGIAALVLSMESVFAALGGWLFLGEQFGSKQLLGCSLMLAGMLVTQWPVRQKQPLPSQS
ncbi:DMT family transporter [Marinobacterium sp. D7]|uniref:DMT family transporter n=1 Tax=Marinobacterium ramblicola TaxID=2849041 RepID=UPI001C2D9652|nr:DMT family transporter [Marinobacterium ramblicola]MBV1788236.1 DMT family transporter [Marinobacterium ramblicola]